MTELPDWARNLDLSPHPEGGWYRETWRSELSIGQSALPPEYTGPRSAGTAILFLLMPGQQSAWHTVRSAEVWLHHRGSPLLLEVGRDGTGGQGSSVEQANATTHLLGSDVAAGERPQFVVPPGHWQRAKPRDDEPTLVSCIVVPGFDFADFALAAPTD
ncbi:MAG: cupin domain-containing protein [Mycobacterium sp.]